MQFYQDNKEAIVITVSRKASHIINDLFVAHLFDGNSPLATVLVACNPPRVVPIHVGMRVMITRNLNKRLGVVNGQLASFHRMRGATLQLKLNEGRMVFVYPLTIQDPSDEEKSIIVYPIVPAYAFTICKAQGQTMKKVAIYFDVDCVPAGSGYVAVTRVRELANLYFITPPQLHHFQVPTANKE